MRQNCLFSCLAASLLASLLLCGSVQAAPVPRTQTVMLSGTGPDDAVTWDFSIDGGRRAGEKARIPVPSNWQQHGFGHYQYGYDKGPRSADTGTYRHRFAVPADWQGRTVRLVFDAVMTDTTVKVNGRQAGSVHQGGFNRFSHDITQLLKPGEDSELEVQVSEASAATATDIAERHGDYWVFGGIYRPVWLEVSPAESIAHVAIAAQASGELKAQVELRAPRAVTRVVGQVRTLDGAAVGKPFTTAIPGGGVGVVQVAGRIERPRPWSAETPHLYWLDVTLFAGETAVHQTRERFGFRTFEVREGQGLYLNGQRIMLKGINRHSFRPETGRAVSRAQAYEDARLIKSMNMNAMRVAHYAPEKAFLEAADELGLYVINELSGWQKAHGTEVGRKLVRALVERDSAARALVRGPTPVWQNRLRGPVLGVHDIAAIGREGLPTPAVAGYFADPRWLTLTSGEGRLTLHSVGAPFLQLGARMADFPSTSVEFPNSDIGFMQAIPGMGAKMQAAELTGPAGMPSTAAGRYSGRLLVRF